MYRQQQQKISHLQNISTALKPKRPKAKQAQSRMKALERMELIAPAYVDNPLLLNSVHHYPCRILW